MKQALNASDIKRTNQRLVLETIFSCETTSRTELSKTLSLSKPAISDNLEPLLRLGIVTEAGEGATGPAGGRKSILLRFNPDHRYIISVNLNYSNPVFVSSNLNGTVRNSFDISIGEGTAPKDCLEMIINGIRLLLQTLGTDAWKVCCVAVAAPGVFDREGNQISFNASCGGPAWWELDLKKELSTALEMPVIIYNDIKAATVGEWIYSPDTLKQNLVYLSVGLGIGSGLILGGKPFLGEGFNAGEIYDYADPSAASFGFNLEDTICIEYLKEQCARLRSSEFGDPASITMEKIVMKYRQGNQEVVQIVDRICRRLANIAYNFMCFLSVPHVIFGGEYAPFFDSFAKNLRQLYLEKNRPVPQILCTYLGKKAGIQGMIYLARNQYFDSICQNEPSIQ